MSLRSLIALFALSTGCATAGPQKVSFAEVFASDARTAPDVEGPKPTKRKVPPRRRSVEPPPAATPKALVASESLDLQAQLVRFGNRARQLRASSRKGAAMPAGVRDNWAGQLGALDALLAQPAEATASTDVIRARATTDAELELDARAYPDFPPALAEQILERVTALGVRMAEVRRVGAQPQRVAASLEWPIEPVVVTSLFGRRLHPVTRTWRPHLGLDLSAYRGQLVTSAGDGTVTRAGWNGAHGRQVEIHHRGGVVTRYSHLAVTLVDDGSRIRKGDPIGLAGQSGVTTGPHLHFEVWKGGKPADPLELIPAPAPPRLERDVPRS